MRDAAHRRLYSSMWLLKYVAVAALVLRNLLHDSFYYTYYTVEHLSRPYYHYSPSRGLIAAATTQTNTTQNAYASSSSTTVAFHSNQTNMAITTTSDGRPHWFTEYLEWHRAMRQSLNETNWQKQRYFLLRCVEGEICAGASDRLQNIPIILRLASLSQRLVFIHWSKPCALQEFLVPPLVNGLDWTLPPWLADKLQANKRIGPYFQSFSSGRSTEQALADWRNTSDPIVRLNRILLDHKHYDAMRSSPHDDEPDFEHAYASIWNALFVPSVGVQAVIHQTQRELGLVPGHYHAAHVRARYTADKVHQHQEVNAVHCAVQLSSRTNDNNDAVPPIFVASDSATTVRFAIQYGTKIGARVVGRANATEPLHLDRGREFLRQGASVGPMQDWQHHSPSRYYDTFADLYLLAGSACLSHGVGGYGRWATLIGPSGRCSNNHVRTKCTVPGGMSQLSNLTAAAAQ